MPTSKHNRTTRAVVVAGLLMCVAGLVIASAAAKPPHAQHLRWIISETAVKRLLEIPDSEPLVRRAFDNPRTWLIVGSEPWERLNGWKCLRIRSFSSYAAMQERIGAATGLWGVLYDPESWRFTPPAERLNLPHYAAEAARLAHSRGLKLIITPATDLARTLVPERKNRTFADSVEDMARLKLAQKIAPAVDVYEIQSQGAQPEPGNLFVRYVEQQAALVRAGNPKAIVLAGLSTNPHGHQDVTGDQMFRQVKDTLHVVVGYWLNIPQGGPSCPTCGRARPDVAMRLLELLDKESLLN